MVSEVTKYISVDGEIFDSMDEAIDHDLAVQLQSLLYDKYGPLISREVEGGWMDVAELIVKHFMVDDREINTNEDSRHEDTL